MRPALILLSLLLGTCAAVAQSGDPGTFHITPSEKAACTYDATRLCASTYPDESALLMCLRANRGSLSSSCLRVFDAGLKRRGL